MFDEKYLQLEIFCSIEKDYNLKLYMHITLLLIIICCMILYANLKVG